MEPQDPCPIRLDPRPVADAALPALSAAAGRRGVHAWIPVATALDLIARMTRTPSPATLMMLATHPDERVLLALLAHPLAGRSRTTRPWQLVGHIAVDRSVNEAGVPRTAAASAPLPPWWNTPFLWGHSWTGSEHEQGFHTPPAAPSAADPFRRAHSGRPSRSCSAMTWAVVVTRLRTWLGRQSAATLAATLPRLNPSLLQQACAEGVELPTAVLCSLAPVVPGAVAPILRSPFTTLLRRAARRQLARAVAPLATRLAEGTLAEPLFDGTIDLIDELAHLGALDEPALWRPLIDSLTAVPEVAPLVLPALLNGRSGLPRAAATPLARAIRALPPHTLRRARLSSGSGIDGNAAVTPAVLRALLAHASTLDVRRTVADSAAVADAPDLVRRLSRTQDPWTIAALLSRVHPADLAPLLPTAERLIPEAFVQAMEARADELRGALPRRALLLLMRSTHREMRELAMRLAADAPA